MAVPVTDWPAPSAVSVVSAVHDARKKSLQVKWTVTGELFHPAAFAAGVAVPLMTGFVVSTTVTWKVAVPRLPPASVAPHSASVVPSGNVSLVAML